MAGAYTVSHFECAHCGHGSKLPAELRHDRRACGRDEFVRFVALPQGDAAEDLQGGGRWDWKTSVLALKPSPAFLKF